MIANSGRRPRKRRQRRLALSGSRRGPTECKPGSRLRGMMTTQRRLGLSRAQPKPNPERGANCRDEAVNVDDATDLQTISSQRTAMRPCGHACFLDRRERPHASRACSLLIRYCPHTGRQGGRPEGSQGGFQTALPSKRRGRRSRLPETNTNSFSWVWTVWTSEMGGRGSRI